MNDAVTRKKHLVRLRHSDQRRTQARLAQAQNDLARLADLSERLVQLRAGLAASRDLSTGHQMRMIGEMTARLDLARAALDAPLLAAAGRCSSCEQDSVRASVRHDMAEQMFEAAQLAHAREQQLRRDAAVVRPRGPVRLKLVGGDEA